MDNTQTSFKGDKGGKQKSREMARITALMSQNEKNFYPKSIDAWMNAILQTIKVFLLNRITPKVFRQLPGMSDQIDGTVSGIMGDDQQQEEIDKEKKLSPELQHALDAKSISE